MEWCDEPPHRGRECIIGNETNHVALNSVGNEEQQS